MLSKRIDFLVDFLNRRLTRRLFSASLSFRRPRTPGHRPATESGRAEAGREKKDSTRGWMLHCCAIHIDAD